MTTTKRKSTSYHRPNADAGAVVDVLHRIAVAADVVVVERASRRGRSSTWSSDSGNYQPDRMVTTTTKTTTTVQSNYCYCCCCC